MVAAPRLDVVLENLRRNFTQHRIPRGAIARAIANNQVRRILCITLDPEQDSSFRDNYLDVTFDLSKVLFITTANMLDPIAEPLRDRMEIIELQGYSEEEKLHIARRYLVPRQVEENGITAEQIEFPDEALRYIIRHYTRDAGVRSLERTIGTICRKQARRLAEGKTEKLVVTQDIIQEFLGGIKISAVRARRPVGPSDPFDDRRVGLPAALAHRLQAEPAARPLDFVHQLGHQDRPGRAQRVPERDGPPVGVGQLRSICANADRFSKTVFCLR